MTLKNPKATNILQDAVQAAREAKLVYVTEKKLTIKRHRHGRGFYYTQDGEKIRDARTLQRMKALVIPPAWEDVRITPLRNGHLQVVGRDAKGRKQYRYHPHWSQLRNKTKFFKLTAFGKMLPTIREQVEKDLRLKKMGKRKCLALVLALMEETHIRIGSDYYARENESYGLSTLRTRHLGIEKNKMKFEFIGKKGKKHAITIKNKRLQRLVMQCEEIPGWELFQYYDEDGRHHSIDSGMVNDYIQEISGVLFSAKDFRTWSGTKIFFETLYSLGTPDTKKARTEHIITAYDAVASGLGNTRAICKTYYVHPLIPEKYLDGFLKEYFRIFDKGLRPAPYLSATETVLLKVLEEYPLMPS